MSTTATTTFTATDLLPLPECACGSNPAPIPAEADQEVAELRVTFRQIARWIDEAAYARTATTYNMGDPARYYASRTADARAYEAQMAMTHLERVAFNAYYVSR